MQPLGDLLFLITDRVWCEAGLHTNRCWLASSSLFHLLAKSPVTVFSLLLQRHIICHSFPLRLYMLPSGNEDLSSVRANKGFLFMSKPYTLIPMNLI